MMVGQNSEILSIESLRMGNLVTGIIDEVCLLLLVKFLGARLQLLVELAWLRTGKSYQTKGSWQGNTRQSNHGSPTL